MSIGQNLVISRIPEGTFRNAERLRFDGDRISFSGRIEPTTAAALPRIREQILGLNNTVDSPVIPITCDAETTLDGYYTQPRATVDYAPGDAALGHFDYSFEAVRVPGRDIPRMEVLTIGGLRTNSHSIAAGSVTPWVGLPGEAVDAWDGEATAPPHEFDGLRALTASSDVGVYVYSTTGINARLARFSVEPANWFSGAATITLDGHAVTGRQVWDSDAATNDWKVSNGLVEVFASGTTAGNLTIQGRNAAGTAWTSRDWDLIYYDSGTPLTIDAFTTLTVIRNTPEIVVVRVGCRSGTRRELAAVDVTIRRGGYIAEFTFRTENSTAKVIQNHTASAAGAATAGRVNQSSGTNRWGLWSPHSFTADTTQGGLSFTTSRLDFGIGYYDNTASAPDSVASLGTQYFGVVEPYQLVVGR